MGENRHLALTPSTMWRCTAMMAISDPGSWLPLATKPTTAWSWISQPSVKNKFPGGFLDGSVVKKKKKKKSSWQYRRHGFDPLSRRSPCAEEQLSSCTTATKPVLQRPGAATTETLCHNYWSPSTVEPVLCTREETCPLQPRSSPSLWQLEKSSSTNKDSAQPKINK